MQKINGPFQFLIVLHLMIFPVGTNVLAKTLETVSSDKNIVLFLDEFPWMSTPKSRLLQNLDYYWNQY